MTRPWNEASIPLALAVGLFLLVAVGAPASACSCYYETFEDAVERSDAIFSGWVTAIDTVEAEGYVQRHVVATFLVDACWKGSVTDSARVHTPENEAVCGVTFEIGESYLVYASERGEERDLWVYLCDRTHRSHENDPDPERLGPPKTVPAEPFTWGRLKAERHG